MNEHAEDYAKVYGITTDDMCKVIADSKLMKKDSDGTHPDVEFIKEHYRVRNLSCAYDYEDAKAKIEDDNCPLDKHDLVAADDIEPDVTPFTLYTYFRCTSCKCIRTKREVHPF